MSSKNQTDSGKPYVSESIFRFCKNFGLQHTVSAMYHPQRNGKAEHVIQAFMESNRKLYFMSMQLWGQILETVANVYKMVPYIEIGMFRY